MRYVKKPQDFEAFYYRYVGKGEACGCAERIIDVHEFNRLSRALVSPMRQKWRPITRLKSLFARRT